MHSGLTPLELAFRELIAGIRTPNGRTEVNPKYSLMCEQDRLAWEAKHVVWFWGRDEHGNGVWSVKRPTGELQKRLRERGELYWMRRSEWEAQRSAASPDGSRLIGVRRID